MLSVHCAKSALFVAALSLTCLPSTVMADLISNYRVFAVGINDYPRSPLPSCVNDATTIADLLSRQGSSAEGKAVLLTDAQATRANVLARLDELAEQAREKSSIAIFFSGHGMRLGERWYYSTIDFDVNQPETTSLAGEEILKAIGRLRDKQCKVLLMLDACNAGEFLRECESCLADWNQPGTGGLIVFTSSAASQYSLAGARHSLFTQTLLEALVPKSDGSPRVTLAEAKRYLSRRMQQRLKIKPKVMGFERLEQDFLADWSLSISDDVTLTEYKADRPRIERDAVPTPPELNSIWNREADVAQTDHSVVGLWKATRDYPRWRAEWDGRPNPYFHPKATWRTPPHVQTLLLMLDDKGNYVIMFQDGELETKTAAGRYEFKPGERFHLRYQSGFDRLGLVSLSQDQMIVKYYPNTYFLSLDDGPPLRSERWEFHRVELKQ